MAPSLIADRYQLLDRLGAGGMGEVWKARDTRLDRVVAIKRLSAGHSAGFEQEARSIAALNHPQTVRCPMSAPTTWLWNTSRADLSAA